LDNTGGNLAIQIVNPCETTTINPQIVNDMETSVLSSSYISQTFPIFSDSASLTYGDGQDKCGSRNY